MEVKVAKVGVQCRYSDHGVHWWDVVRRRAPALQGLADDVPVVAQSWIPP